MIIYSIYTILILSLSFTTVQNFRYSFSTVSKCECNTTEDDDNNDDDDLEDIEEVANHLPAPCCPIKVVKIINPYKDEMIIQRDVLPVCLKCAMCLAVSEKIEHLFKAALKSNECNASLDQNSILWNNFLDIPNNAFKNHDLRNFNGYYILSDDFEDTTHVRSSFDGQWPHMLKNISTHLLNNLDLTVVLDIYNQYKKDQIKLAEYFCRGEGVFRECRNIHFESKERNTKSNYWVKCLLSVIYI